MRHSPHVLALAIVASLASAPVFAGTPIDQTRPLAPTGRIEISNLKGSIEVRAWDRNEVHVSGEGVEKVVVDGSRDHLEVKVEYPNRRGWGDDRTEPTRLVLQVPLRANLDIESVAADIRVDGVAPRELDVESVSGNITIAAAPGEADVSSVSGDGLLLGVVLTEPVAAKVQQAALNAGLILNAPTPDRLRLAPPLILTSDEAGIAATALGAILDEVVNP